MKDIGEAEFQAAWQQIKDTGFEHAWDSLQEEVKKARELGYQGDATVFEAQIAKFRLVHANPTEELEKY